MIDLVVFFWFTHPMVSWLARFPFFNTGHKLSGLDAARRSASTGSTSATPSTVGGRA